MKFRRFRQICPSYFQWAYVENANDFRTSIGAETTFATCDIAGCSDCSGLDYKPDGRGLGLVGAPHRPAAPKLVQLYLVSVYNWKLEHDGERNWPPYITKS